MMLRSSATQSHSFYRSLESLDTLIVLADLIPFCRAPNSKSEGKEKREREKREREKREEREREERRERLFLGDSG